MERYSLEHGTYLADDGCITTVLFFHSTAPFVKRCLMFYSFEASLGLILLRQGDILSAALEPPPPPPALVSAHHGVVDDDAATRFPRLENACRRRSAFILQPTFNDTPLLRFTRAAVRYSTQRDVCLCTPDFAYFFFLWPQGC